MRWIATALGFLVLSLVSTSLYAQSVAESTPLPARALALVMERPLSAPDLLESSSTARTAELAKWMDDFLEWQAWSARWRGRREPGWFTSFKDRPEKPEPPSWLHSVCVTVFDDSDPLKTPCTLLAAWRDDAEPQDRQYASAAVATQTEQPEKTIWWEHVHLDLLWPALEQQASIFGVIGMHTTATVHGRLQIFLTPGAMLLNVPARNGGRVWKIATNYGIGYGLFDFTFPGGRPATLHINLAKSWLLSDVGDALVSRSTDFVGLSVSFKKDR